VRFRIGSNISAQLPNGGRPLILLRSYGGWMGLHKLANALFLLTVSLTLGGCSWTPLRITTQPSNQTVIAGQTTTFSVAATELVATEPPTLTYQWQKGSTPVPGATFASYTIPPASTFDNGSKYSVVVKSEAGSITSSAATLTVTAPGPADVLTYHNDIARTGQNLTETSLTISNVNSASFGKVGFYPVDGLVDAEPLYASNVPVPNKGTHNLLIVPTENDSVYAFDADSGATIWHVSVLQTGEMPAPDPICGATAPVIGVTSTPVIDRTRGPNGAVYVEAMSATTEYGPHFQRLHALDLALGTELLGGPAEIEAAYPGTGDNTDGTNVQFDPSLYRERAALLLLNGNIYTSWASHCDFRPYTGWIIAYNASTLTQSSVLNITPNGYQGAIWMSGAGPAADSLGNIYFADANGDFGSTFDSQGFPSNGDYGNAFMKLSTSAGLAVSDFFEMDNEAVENAEDADLGSGGAVVLPDLYDASGNTVHLAITAGKDSNLYVANRDSMGKFSASNNNIYQEIQGGLPGGLFSAPAYFNNTVYFGSVGSPILAYTVSNAQLLSTPAARTANSFAYPGTTPSISANGTANGIVWAVENSTTAVLHAYNATSLNELYNSNQNQQRDQFGPGNKFITPTIVNGKVFVGTTNGVAVFGLLSTTN